MNNEEDLLGAIAESQHGIITRRQAVEIGLSQKAIDRRLATGAWDPLFRGVYRVAGSGRSWEQRAMAACLAAGPGAVASFRAAANLHGMTGVPPWLEVTVARPRQVEVGGLIVHRTTLLGPADRGVVRGIPATSASRTVIDLASELPADRLGALIDCGLMAGLFTLPGLWERLSALRAKGRKGVLLLEDLLLERSGHFAVPEAEK